MRVLETGLDGVVIIEPTVHGDDRGFFQESWKASSYGAHGLPTTFLQANISRSAQGVLRGLLAALKRILRCHPLSGGGFDPVK